MRTMVLAAVLVSGLIGCANNDYDTYGGYGSSTYPTSTACGGTSTGGLVGGLAGAAGGGLLGHQFGRGKGNDAATAAGALAGGAGGYMAGRNLSGC